MRGEMANTNAATTRVLWVDEARDPLGRLWQNIIPFLAGLEGRRGWNATWATPGPTSHSV